MAVLPVANLDIYVMGILISANVLAIFATSWDLLVGRSGQMSLGHALFFGIGAYATALLHKYYALPPWITIPIAVAIGTGVGVTIGFPCLRIKGPYLALVTMAFPIIFTSVVYTLRDIFGGEFGVRDVPAFFPGLPIEQQKIAEYYLTLLVLLISAVALYKIANSHTGIVFVSILDDQLAAKASGINVTKYKLMAFAISGFFASLAGCIFAHLLRVASPPALSLTTSFGAVIVTFLGGIGTIYGPVMGAYVYYFIDRYFLTIITPLPYEFIDAKLLIFTMIVAFLVIKWPRGLGRFVTDKLGDFEEARDIDERGPKIWKTYKKKEKK
jgi:branched-chain amino acid transport system permease protein